MTAPAALRGARVATRLAFVAAGFALACWAPLVPFAKARVGANDAQLGLILLCLGIGSVVAMPITGWLSARLGSRPVLIASGIGTALLLPCLPLAPAAWVLALALAGFGASIGTLDVAMNVHAVEVERQSGRPLMSGFHAMFSVGGFLGSGGMTILLSAGARPAPAALLGAALAATAIALAWPRLLPAQARPAPIAMPHGLVLVLAALAAIMFLVEGALLDWGALLVVDAGLATAARAGLGYTLFSIAMTVGRLTGDRVVARLGDGRVVTLGASVALAGFVVLLTAGWAPVAMGGFLLIGLGAANIVPVLFRLAGRQTVMPVGLAVAALTTAGYAGVLAGPAGIGFFSHAFGLPTAFWALAAVTSLVPLGTWRVNRSVQRARAGLGGAVGVSSRSREIL